MHPILFMRVSVANTQKDYPISIPLVRRIVHAVLWLEGISSDEVGVHFVTKRAIGKLHEVYFNDPSPTDCISFPLNPPHHATDYAVLGDIFVCPRVALEYAEAHDLVAGEEVTLYIVHGLLHLIGYDDMNVKDRRCMRLAERKHMANLKKLRLCL